MVFSERIGIVAGPQSMDERRPISNRLLDAFAQINPLGPGILAAILNPYGFNNIHYQNYELNNPPDVSELDIMMISARQIDESWATGLIRQCNEQHVSTVVGGYGPSLDPKPYESAGATVIVRGEVEPVSNELLHSMANHFPQKNITIASSELWDMKQYVWPDRSIYPKAWMTNLETGRGCLYSCAWCSAVQMQKTPARLRPIGDVMGEIDSLNLPSGSHFFISDLNFALRDRDEQMALFEFLAKRGLKFSAEASAIQYIKDDEAFCDRSMLAYWGKHRLCWEFLYGADDLDPENGRGKGVKTHQNLIEISQRFRRYGIPFAISTVIGLDHHTFPETFYRYLEAIAEVNPAHVFVNIATPHKGSPWGDQIAAEGRILDTQPSHYTHRQVVHRPNGMSVEELQQGYYWLVRQANSASRSLQAIRNIHPSMFMINPAYALLQGGVPFNMRSMVTSAEARVLGFVDPAMQKELDLGFSKRKNL